MILSKPVIFKLIPTAASLVVILLVTGWFILSYTNYRPSLSVFSPGMGQYNLEVVDKIHYNQPFKATVKVNTNGQTINAIGLNINYSSDKLRVINIDTTKSFCQFYPEKKFNNSLGTISLSCGSPSPGFSGESTVLVVEFMPVKVGSTEISITRDSKILKSDGKGTNILGEFPSRSLTIINAL